MLNNKTKTKYQVLLFINALQKAIMEKRIRKTSKYASEIKNIQEQLVKLYNKMPEQIKVDIDAPTIEKYKEITDGVKTMLSITYIKRYIGIHGKTGVKEKAKRLFDQMKKAAESKKLKLNDPYKAKLEIIYNSLNDYITGKTTTPTIQKAELNGLMGITGKKTAIKEPVSKKKHKRN